MNRPRLIGLVGRFAMGLVLGGCLMLPLKAVAEPETKLDMLQVGSTVYRNVTVTSKNTNYVFIIHASGMTNLRWSDLSPEARKQLGYVEPAPPKVETNSAALWTKQALAKIDAPKVQALRTEAATQFQAKFDELKQRLPPVDQKMLAMVGGGLFALYLFNCWCLSLICRKAGKEAGVLIWLPFLQVFPILRAASMSYWWVLALLVPGVNLLASLICWVRWCFRIVDARGKNSLLAVLLLLPVTNLFAFLYLAFSDVETPKKAESKMQIMTLETA